MLLIVLERRGGILLYRAVSKLLLVILVSAFIIALVPSVYAATYQFQFHGPYVEGTTNEYPNNATVIFHYYDGSTYNVTGNHTFSYSASNPPLYFTFVYSFTGGEATHDYWLTSDELTASLSAAVDVYLSFSEDATPIVINIRALGGIEVDGLVSVTNNVVVEQKPVDDNNVVSFNLSPYEIYSVTLESVGGSEYTFENINVYTSPITLTVSPLSFPSSVMLQYKYLHIWASRPSSTEIQVSYEDTNEQTLSVDYTLSFENGTVAYWSHHVGNSFVDLWTGASSNITYYLDAEVSQVEFGNLTFAQVLLRDGASSSPIDLSFLGDWPVDPTQVFWMIVILIIFGCFSVLNAYVGGFAGVAVAIVLAWLGWIDVPQGSLVAAMCIVIMAAIVYWKRRT